MTDTEQTGTFTTTGWDEQPWVEEDGGAKLSTAHVTNTWAGPITGDAKLDMVMFYEPRPADAPEGSWGTGTFLAFEHVTGTVGGRAGSFVLREQGTFAGSDITAELTVEPGSGTGDLAGLGGTGRYTLSMGDPAASYDFDPTFGP